MNDDTRYVHTNLIARDYGAPGVLTAVYARDPEGNLFEIQNWRK